MNSYGKDFHELQIDEIVDLAKEQPLLYDEKVRKYKVWIHDLFNGNSDNLPDGFRFTPLVDYSQYQVNELTQEAYAKYAEVLRMHAAACNEEAHILQREEKKMGPVLGLPVLPDFKDLLQGSRVPILPDFGDKFAFDKESYLKNLWEIACKEPYAKVSAEYSRMETIIINALRESYRNNLGDEDE